MNPSLPILSYLLWAMFTLVFIWLFWVMIRGRKHQVTPGCPRCLYCVTGTTGNICPECGNDLAGSGIYLHGRRRIGRLYRLVIVMIFVWLLWPFYANSTQNFWAQAAIDLFGVDDDLGGHHRLEYRLYPDKSRFSGMFVLYPDPLTITPSAVGDPVSVWTPPQPVRLRLVEKGGVHREYLITSASEDHSIWQAQRVATLSRNTNNTFKPGPPTEGSRDAISDIVLKRIQQDDEVQFADDRGVQLAGAITQHMAEIMMGWTPAFEGPPTFVVDNGFSDVQMLTNHEHAITTVPVPRVGWYWPMMVSWSLLWLIILVITLLPGTRTDPWNPDDHLASS